MEELQHRIPLLVRSIWGHHSEAVVAALRTRQAAAARRLIAQWEEAEHRLVAVANSLTTLQTGQVRRRWLRQGRGRAAPPPLCVSCRRAADVLGPCGALPIHCLPACFFGICGPPASA